MRKETDLAKIKAVAHTFLVMDIQPTAHAPVVVSHPFTNSGFVGVRDVEGNLAIADLLNKPEDCCLWREQIGQYIDQADSAYQVFLLLNKPYTAASRTDKDWRKCGVPCCGSRQRTPPRSRCKRRATANFIQSAQCDKQLFVGADEWIYFKQCGNVFAANHQPATKRKGVHTMKTQKRQVTITDLYNLVAHETVSLLEAVDDNAIPLALEMREGLTMLAAAAGSGEGVETHLEWIDQEIENLKQTAGTPQCVTHLIPTSQLVRTVAIDAQIDMTLEFFRIVAETDEQETRTKLLELARTTTDMCGMGDCLFNCGGDAVEMMNQIWDAFSEATVTENGENRRDLLGKAAVTANELHELTEPQEELEDGRMFMSMDELSAELDEIAHMIARQNNEPQLS